MLTQKNFEKILNYLDTQYWSNKTDETNWNYYGLIFDYLFNDSVLSIDYLNIFDYLDENGSFHFIGDKGLIEQYQNISESKYLLLIQNFLNILKHSQLDKEQNVHVITRISNVLSRQNIKVVVPEVGDVVVKLDDILDSGSYCNIMRMPNGILRKELRKEYKDDIKIKKRMRYEFENMEKLGACPQILNVIDFDDETNSYLMEQADMNLLTYLSSEIELLFEEKMKIIIDILKGMSYAHENNIIHRDLHLGNVLKIGNDFVICDFGLSKDLSIVRSLKSSYTEKNNHIFVDPLAVSDFTLLDKKSDIYSIGKMIDYILTYNAKSTNHILKTIVERCISREKSHRYESIAEIMADVNITLKYQNEEQDKSQLINQILNNQYNAKVHEYIIDLSNNNKLCTFIVTHKLHSFGQLLIQFDSVHKILLLNTLIDDFSEATGYGGWTNYDIFAQIAYYLCSNLTDLTAKNMAYSILEQCAEIRFFAQNLLDKLVVK